MKHLSQVKFSLSPLDQLEEDSTRRRRPELPLKSRRGRLETFKIGSRTLSMTPRERRETLRNLEQEKNVLMLSALDDEQSLVAKAQKEQELSGPLRVLGGA